MNTNSKPQRLSKSRFVAGWQCPALLWRRVHEPDAPELVPDKVLQDRFDQGAHVGEVARARFAEGVLIDVPYWDYQGRVAATEVAINDGAPAIFEASFLADDVFVAVDVLERADEGFNLIEVKSSTSQKDEHIPDAAIQAHVLRQSGIDVARAEIMHLSKEHRCPDVSDLFHRTDVTNPVEGLLPLVPEEIHKQLEVIRGPEPDIKLGLQCFEPRRCPFINRCWPEVPNHISTLAGVGAKGAWQYILEGIETIDDIPKDRKLPAKARRQIRALEEGRMIVEPGLADALEPFSGRLGYLDFETVGRAIPVWSGLGPWHQATAQFSYHEETGDGELSHVGWLAEGPERSRSDLPSDVTRPLFDPTRGPPSAVVALSHSRACSPVPSWLREIHPCLTTRLVDHHDVVQPVAGEVGYGEPPRVGATRHLTRAHRSGASPDDEYARLHVVGQHGVLYPVAVEVADDNFLCADGLAPNQLTIWLESTRPRAAQDPDRPRLRTSDEIDDAVAGDVPGGHRERLVGGHRDWRWTPARHRREHDSDLVPVWGDEINRAVPVHIRECHAPVGIAADVDARPRRSERGVPAPAEHGDRLGVAVVHQQIKMPCAVEVDSLDGVRVRPDAHIER